MSEWLWIGNKGFGFDYLNDSIREIDWNIVDFDALCLWKRVNES